MPKGRPGMNTFPNHAYAPLKVYSIEIVTPRKPNKDSAPAVKKLRLVPESPKIERKRDNAQRSPRYDYVFHPRPRWV